MHHRPTTPRLKLAKESAPRVTKEHPKPFLDNSLTQPITPAVTDLTYPATSPERPFIPPRPSAPEPFSTPQGSSDGSFDTLVTPDGCVSLGQLWDNLRYQKQLKEAKSPPKVKSLEDPDYYRSIKPTLKKKKSQCTFREAPDGRTVTAIFDLPGLKKKDVHISFQRNRLVVTWQTVNVTEREEDGRLVRECKENKCSRTIPLPEGTRFEEVRADMSGRSLTLTYPNMRNMRAEPRPKTPAAVLQS